jgi:hypothetical protein
MHCPHCGLTVRLRAAFLTLDVCPRCLARHRVARPMELAADGEAPSGDSGPVREVTRRIAGAHMPAHGLR